MSYLWQILIISVSLALDALSVSVAGGIKTHQAKVSEGLKIALFFGVFQAAMPIIGWLIGIGVKDLIVNIDHWIAFILLSAIGVKMIKEALEDNKEKEKIKIHNNKVLLFLAVATSIDALMVGVTFGVTKMPILFSVVCIGLVTFILSFLGFLFGKKLGSFFEGKIEIIGGIALIGIGFKILIEHLMG